MITFNDIACKVSDNKNNKGVQDLNAKEIGLFQMILSAYPFM